jgi:SAM-dependent methyltransferase
VDAEQWNERYAAAELWGVEPNRFVSPAAAGLSPGRALDLACGEGRNAIWLAQQGWNVVAVDFAEVAIDRGHRRARELGVEIDWIVADLRTWTPPERAFDFVLLSYLQLPAHERVGVWAGASRAVAPGGTFFLVGHDARNVSDGVGGPQDVSVCYTAADVVEAIGELHVDEAREIERPVDDGVAIDCLVRATAIPARDRIR